MEINQVILKEIVDYNPDTGIMIWKIAPSKKVKVGDRVGHIDDLGRYNKFTDAVMARFRAEEEYGVRIFNHTTDAYLYLKNKGVI